MGDIYADLVQWDETRWLQELQAIASIPCPSPGGDLSAIKNLAFHAYIALEAQDHLDHDSAQFKELREAWETAMQHLCGPMGVAWALGSMQDNKEAMKLLNSEEMQLIILQYSNLVKSTMYSHAELKVFKQQDLGPIPAFFLKQCKLKVMLLRLVIPVVNMRNRKWPPHTHIHTHTHTHTTTNDT